MTEFDGKVALVTGTTGIGRAIAIRFAHGGAKVLACGIQPDSNRELIEAAQSSGYVLEVETCDVADFEQVRATVEKTVNKFGGLDIVVNAAAIHPFGTVLQTDFATWNRCMMVNVSSIYLTAHLGIPEMKKRGRGSIINLASVQGYACQSGVAAYATSKGAIHSLTRALALDHAADNIRVNSISPGSIRTPMLARSAANFAPGLPEEEAFARFGAAHPLKRIGTPEEVAELAAFLASDKAGFCTGGDYLVDGGLLAGIGVQ
ncbi:MAG TPA: SDR family oxidoreductase [Candidatus Sulfotelmatobacter sp.]|jgi:NAD(P)-dependent dehydrogenase (short-subunit alcohol dehydrogenase family)